MRLEVHFEGRSREIELDPQAVDSAQGLFDQMDRDMDGGWKMGPEFIEHPDRLQRAQIAAERLLLAIEQGNEAMAQAMAGYIASRLPEVRAVHVDTSGEPQHTELRTADGLSLSA